MLSYRASETPTPLLAPLYARRKQKEFVTNPSGFRPILIEPPMDFLQPDDALDLRLVTAAQSDDREALDELIRRHQPWLLHIAQRMLWNRADAEDAAQEILIKAVTKLATFQQRSSFRTWLYRIAANHLLDRSRTKSFDQLA